MVKGRTDGRGHNLNLERVSRCLGSLPELSLEGRVKPESTAKWGTRANGEERLPTLRVGGLRHLNHPNRRIRTRMYGGVGGEEPRGSPLSRLYGTSKVRSNAMSSVSEHEERDAVDLVTDCMYAVGFLGLFSMT